MANYVATENFVVRKIGNSTLAIPIVRELSKTIETYSLNGTAAEILEQITQGKTTNEITEVLIQDFEDENHEQVRTDVLDCLKDLEAIHLIRES